MLQALNALMLAVNKKNLKTEDLSYLKKELQELASLLPKKT